MSLQLNNLHISVEDKPIVTGLSLEIKPGEVHAIMGPNGSGKSTLANAVMGHPKYTITKGTITLDNNDITNEKPDKKSLAGLFLSMQYSPEIPGVAVSNFLRLAVQASTGKKQNPVTFHKLLVEKIKELHMDPSFATRHLNAGFSGGEKKRLEILQLITLNPKYAILDETDSGLDVDALKIVAEGINRFHNAHNGIVLITHYNRILEYVQPDFVHIMYQGRIIKSGGKELASDIEKNGFQKYLTA